MENLTLPKEFISSIDEILSQNEKADFLASLNLPSPTCIRINPDKNQKIITTLIKERATHSPDVYILKERPVFVGDPGWHCGAYYVQELNSTRVGETVKWLLDFIPAGCVVLDLCGAPGGKSTHISSVLREDDLLIANEVIQGRNPILVENLTKWGKGNFLVTRADAKDFKKSTGFFSIIAADMPCSGEGMFRKDPKSINEWSVSNVKLCASRQLRIAEDIWDSLEIGGYFIYSTCTYNSQENENNVNRICTELGGELVALPDNIVVNSISFEKNTYRFFPHTTNGEGLFLAVIKKNRSTSISPSYEKVKKTKDHTYKSLNLPEGLSTHWLGNENKEGEIYLTKRGIWFDKHPDLFSKLPQISCLGIPIGLYHKSLWKTSAAFDLLIQFDIQYPSLSISIEQAIQYYLKEFLPIKNHQKGIVGLRWNGLSLGTGNVVNNGINNLWPSHWRIQQKNTVANSILKFTASV